MIKSRFHETTMMSREKGSMKYRKKVFSLVGNPDVLQFVSIRNPPLGYDTDHSVLRSV